MLNPFMETLALEVTRALQFFYTSTQYQPGQSHLPVRRLRDDSRTGPGRLPSAPKSMRWWPILSPTWGIIRRSSSVSCAGCAGAAWSQLRPRHAEVRRMIPINLLPHRAVRRKAQQRQFLVLAATDRRRSASARSFWCTASWRSASRRRTIAQSLSREPRSPSSTSRSTRSRSSRSRPSSLLARKRVVESLQANRTEAVRLLDQLVRQLPGRALPEADQADRRCGQRRQGYATSNARVSTLDAQLRGLTLAGGAKAGRDQGGQARQTPTSTSST